MGGDCHAVGWVAVLVVDVEDGKRAAQRVTELAEGLRQRVGELGGRPEDCVGVRGDYASVGELLVRVWWLKIRRLSAASDTSWLGSRSVMVGRSRFREFGSLRHSDDGEVVVP